MTDRDLNNINEQEFDALLAQSLSQLPPPDAVVNSVTPWKKAMRQVSIGLAFTTIAFEFAYLQYILPIIGHFFLLLGFRSLRTENRWFCAGLILSLPRMVQSIFQIIVCSTIWQEEIFSHPVFTVLAYVNMALEFVILFCLWRAILAAQRKAGLTPGAKEAVFLMAWYVLLFVLAVLSVKGLLLGLLMIAAFVLILWSLSRLSRRMEDAGYAMRPARIRISDKALILILLAVIIGGILIGTFCCGRYPMEWTTAQAQAQTPDTEAVRTELEALGVPEHILDDVSEEDLLACGGAVRVLMQEYEMPMNDGRKVSETTGNRTTIYTVFDMKELHVTSIAIELSEPKGHWKVIHYFEWVTTPDFIGTEAVKILPAYSRTDNYTRLGEITGQLFYNADGVAYTADYHSLFEQEEAASFESYFLICGAFSFPNKGEQHRGYISYEVLNHDEYHIFNSAFHYTHQRAYCYPSETALSDLQDTSLFSSNDAFVERWYALQFWPVEGILFSEL